MESSPPTKRQKIDFSESIVVTVGEEKKACVLHKSLTKSSEFFKAALSGDWREAANGTVHVQDFEPYHFDHYAHWLYTGRVCLGADSDAVNWAPPDIDFPDDYLLMMDLYVMSYFLLDETFRNCMMDVILKTGDLLRSYPGELCIARFWDRIPEDAPLKKMVVNDWAHGMKAGDISGIFEQMPPDFVNRVLHDVLIIREDDEQAKVPLPDYAHRCDYHEHKDDSAKCS